MIEYLDHIDKKLFLFLNGIHIESMDTIMWWVSSTTIWIPFYIVLLFFLIKKENPSSLKKQLKNISFLVISIAIAILLADQISSGFFKPFFQRFRPSHNPNIMNLVHVITKPNGDTYRGGLYGFVSSHAANSFAIAWFSCRILKYKSAWISLITWALLVSYSRIYLGVHYPGDILGGALIGIGSGTLATIIYYKLKSKWI